MLIEGLIALIVFFALAVYGLYRLLNDIFDKAQIAKDERDDIRILMRQNMNGLLDRMSYSSDPLELDMLQHAYAASRTEYRKLCR